MLSTRYREESLQDYLLTKLNQYNIIDILDILDKDFSLDDRINHSEYYSKAVHIEWSRFCKSHPTMSKAELTEKALIYGMLTIPNKNVLIQIDSPDKKCESLDDQLDEIILIEELSTEMKHLHMGKTIHITKKKRLLKLLKRCQKLDIRGNKIETLMKEAMSYITQSDA